jgi:hypothetical protein
MERKIKLRDRGSLLLIIATESMAPDEKVTQTCNMVSASTIVPLSSFYRGRKECTTPSISLINILKKCPKRWILVPGNYV